MSAQPDYYQGANHRIIERVPPVALRVLDIGCGAGNLGQILKDQQPNREVWGIELVPSVAAQAKTHLDHVLVGNVEEMIPLPLPPAYFDCIVCGDVLEHLREHVFSF